jgi:hypothetical protein
MTITKHSENTKAQGLDDSQKHSANRQKNTKVTCSYIKSVSVVSDSLGLISSVLQFSAEFCFDTQTLRKLTINVEKNF